MKKEDLKIKRLEAILKVKKLHKILRRRPIKSDDNHLYLSSRKYFGSWNKMMEEAGYGVKYNQYPKLPQRLIPNLSYFLGLLITDGHLQYTRRYSNRRVRYGLFLFTSYEKERDMILELIKKLFSYDSFVRSRKYGFNKRTNFQIYVNSKALVVCLNNKFEIPTGNKSLIVRVPKMILNSDIINKTNFVRGVIDGDGYITNFRVRICSGSYLFLKDFKRLLLDINVDSGKIENRGTCYVLNLNKKESGKVYLLCYKNANYFYGRKKVAFGTNQYL